MGSVLAITSVPPRAHRMAQQSYCSKLQPDDDRRISCMAGDRPLMHMHMIRVLNDDAMHGISLGVGTDSGSASRMGI